MRRTIRVAAVLALALAWAATASASLVIPALSYGWVDTGVNVAGPYQVTASGTWSWGSGDYVTATGNDAVGALWDEYYAGAQKAGLVAYVGAAPGGDLAPVGSPGYYAILDGMQYIDFGAGGHLWMVINDDGQSWAWDDNAGALTVDLTAVPEPATIALSGLAAAVLMIFRRRK